MNRVEINTLIDKLIGIKDSHRGEFTFEELDTINDACNLIEHNIKVLEDK